MFTISFSQVESSKAPLTHIEREVAMRPEFLERSQKLLYKVENVRLDGDAFYNEPYVTCDLHVTADLVVPSSRSLEPVTYHEDFRFSENYSEDAVSKEELEASETPIVQVEDDQIDLQTAIEDNLLLHIPTTILTPEEEDQDIYPEGNGWAVISEAEFDEGKKNQVNPAFAKLKELLDQKDNQQDKD
ncbi:DUF177 domain-containing protein [Lactobacillus sp. ESL0731]|uniref:DUF177 domain-containing protein n=1 Tax=unclassified Lactobacillus TaxID=2620435 RepID=UPI0023FA3706|nr:MULTISPECIES: DUF177 domain-containing protein [unclassified Lactobacillus]WEV50553.1 DUF177 domain-containing protein [Lactobacillus sp. ESL0700]WEV61683.1 DUF177 domain-containing protein [Lactobacillus sp. ESL0731]